MWRGAGLWLRHELMLQHLQSRDSATGSGHLGLILKARPSQARISLSR